MLGKRSRQRGLFEADNQYLEFVGRDSFYGFPSVQMWAFSALRWLLNICQLISGILEEFMIEVGFRRFILENPIFAW